MRIMAIDYGDAHTGIAISDPTGLLAGFTTVINSRRQEVVVEQVTLLAKEHGGTGPGTSREHGWHSWASLREGKGHESAAGGGHGPAGGPLG